MSDPDVDPVAETSEFTVTEWWFGTVTVGSLGGGLAPMPVT
jgi:hypothetical protein